MAVMKSFVDFFALEKCLTFWYHSFGEDVGAINVYKKHTSHKQPYLRTLLWYDDRNQGDQWLFTKIRVNDHLPYQVKGRCYF